MSRRRRWLRRVVVALAALFIGYGALLVYPQPFFPHAHSHRQLILYSDEPFADDAQVEALLARVEARLVRSSLDDPRATYRVFLCQARRRFALFANVNFRVGGVLSLVGRNVFIRPSSIERDRVFGPSGAEVEGERTLTYFVTHELAHTMTLDALGRRRYAFLPEWKREGVADFVALPQFDVAAARVDLAAGAARMDHDKSGLYDGFHLQVIDALANGASVDQLLGR